MNVAAAMMVMPNRERTITVPIGVRIRGLIRGHMNVGRVMNVICLNKSNGRPACRVSEEVVRLRQAMQVHGRQDGDSQADAEVADQMRQQELRCPCSFRHARRQSIA